MAIQTMEALRALNVGDPIEVKSDDGSRVWRRTVDGFTWDDTTLPVEFFETSVTLGFVRSWEIEDAEAGDLFSYSYYDYLVVALDGDFLWVASFRRGGFRGILRNRKADMVGQGWHRVPLDEQAAWVPMARDMAAQMYALQSQANAQTQAISDLSERLRAARQTVVHASAVAQLDFNLESDGCACDQVTESMVRNRMMRNPDKVSFEVTGCSKHPVG